MNGCAVGAQPTNCHHQKLANENFYAEEAVDDLLRLRAFIAEKSPAAASRIAKDLITRVEKHCLFPQMGIEVPRAPLTGSIRDMVFGSYVIRYAAQNESIIVVRI